MIIRALQIDLFRWLGTFSLPLYLAHYIVASALCNSSRHFFGDDGGGRWSRDLLTVCCYFICFGYACTVQRLLDYWCVEEDRQPIIMCASDTDDVQSADTSPRLATSTASVA